MTVKNQKALHKIAVLGAESSGKTALVESLADLYDSPAVYEYAREYMTDKNLSYEELEVIAREQMRREDEAIKISDSEFIFFDTELINLQKWFQYGYGSMPAWIAEMRPEDRYDYYLITENDLEYIPDELRYFPDIEQRENLKNVYVSEVEKSGIPYDFVSGLDEQRLENARSSIEKFLKNSKLE